MANDTERVSVKRRLSVQYNERLMNCFAIRLLNTMKAYGDQESNALSGCTIMFGQKCDLSVQLMMT